MMTLKSMTDFVLEIDSKAGNGGHYDKIVRYAKFLKQPLKLEMFVPVDDEGNHLSSVEKPLSPASDKEWDAWINFKKAKDKILFKVSYMNKIDTEIKIKFLGYRNRDPYYIKELTNSITIEDIIKNEFNPELTETAIKQLGL